MEIVEWSFNDSSDLGTSVNAILTSGGRLCPPITTPPPQISSSSEIPLIDYILENKTL